MSGQPAWSEEEQREVRNSGLAVSAYSAVRSAGAAHHEVMEAHVLGADLPTYAVFRVALTHRSALDEAGAPGTPSDENAHQLGVSRSELAEVRSSHRATVDAYWSILAVDGRAPTSDVSVTRIGDYLTGRRAGLAHSDALHFAQRVAAVHPRPDPRDLLLWARCRSAGLPGDRLFSTAPRSRGRLLSGREIEVLTAALFAARSFASPPVDLEEMVWLAARDDAARIDIQAYLTARNEDKSRRSALRSALRSTTKKNV